MANTQLTQTGAQVQADLNLTENLQQAFSTSSTYAVGDMVVYDGKLWRCITAVSSAGSWTGSSNWAQIHLSDLSSVRKYLQHIKLSSQTDGDGFCDFEFITKSPDSLTPYGSGIPDRISNIVQALYSNYGTRSLPCVQGGGSTGDAYDVNGFIMLSVCAIGQTLKFIVLTSSGMESKSIRRNSTSEIPDLGNIEDMVIAL